jgi:hypothetical protein
MNKITLIVLTKSDKFSNYCVAGIQENTGRWVRLVTQDEKIHGAVKKEDLINNKGIECQILDIIKVSILGSENSSLQPENIIMDTTQYIEIVGKSDINKVLSLHPPKIIDNILGNPYSYITEPWVRAVGYSLILVEVNDLIIKQVVNPKGKNKTKVDFKYQSKHKIIHYSDFSVTDKSFYSVKDKTHYKNAYLIISIGTPFNNKYYKFVSAIYV